MPSSIGRKRKRTGTVTVAEVVGQLDLCISALSGPLTREMIGSGWNKRTLPEMLDFLNQWRERITTDGVLRSEQQTGVWRWLYEDADFADSGGDVGEMIMEVDRMIKAGAA